jgi:MFS family permease
VQGNNYGDKATIPYVAKMGKLISATPPREPHHVVVKEKFGMYNYMVVIAVAIGSVASGMVGGIISATLAQPSFLEYFGFLIDTKSNTALVGATLGVFYAGGFTGTLIMTWVADTYGRKMALSVASIISILSSALIAGSVHIAMFLVFRLPPLPFSCRSY